MRFRHVTSQVLLRRESPVANLAFKLRGFSNAVCRCQVPAQVRFRVEFLTAYVTLEPGSMRRFVVIAERRQIPEAHATDLATYARLSILKHAQLCV